MATTGTTSPLRLFLAVTPPRRPRYDLPALHHGLHSELDVHVNRSVGVAGQYTKISEHSLEGSTTFFFKKIPQSNPKVFGSISVSYHTHTYTHKIYTKLPLQYQK